jgi:antitoxin (DNA-binding transcriptional repressor) of toxin-antitoxin stability system
MTSKRNRQHRGFETAYLLDPVDARVIEGLTVARERLVRVDFMGIAGRPWPRGARPEDGDDHTVLRLPDELDDLEVLQRVRAGGYAGHPIGIGIAGSRVAVVVPHELADGTESSALLQGLLAAATGVEPPVPDRPVRFPVLRAIRSVGPSSFIRYVQQRSERTPPSVSAATLDDPALVSLTLDGDRLTQVRRGRSSGGRASISTRLASIAVSALLASARDERVAELQVPVDLRHEAGGRVAGNFVQAVTLGTVDSSQTPGAISVALAARREGLIPAMVSGELNPRHLLRRHGPAGPGRLGVGLSMMQVPDLPDTVWATPSVSARRFVCTSLGEGAVLLVVIATARDAAFVSLIDCTGWIDSTRFEHEFLSEIESRRQSAG